MLGLLSELFTYLFLGSQVLKLINNKVDTTNSPDSLILTKKNITLIVIEGYEPLPVRLAAYCI